MSIQQNTNCKSPYSSTNNLPSHTLLASFRASDLIRIRLVTPKQPCHCCVNGHNFAWKVSMVPCRVHSWVRWILMNFLFTIHYWWIFLFQQIAEYPLALWTHSSRKEASRLVSAWFFSTLYPNKVLGVFSNRVFSKDQPLMSCPLSLSSSLTVTFGSGDGYGGPWYLSEDWALLDFWKPKLPWDIIATCNLSKESMFRSALLKLTEKHQWAQHGVL